MIIVAEKLNGAIPSMAKAIAGHDGEWIKDIARKEAEAGAAFIDVCVSVETGELEMLHWLIDLIQSVTDTPISIDSPSTEILVEAWKFCKRPGMFNSVSMESRKQIDTIFQIMAENPGWEVIAMLCDDTGIPRSAAERLRVFGDIMKKAERYGIDPSRIHIDPIIEAAALMDPDREDGPGIAINTKVIDAIREQYPTIHITSAISNISHGLPARKYMNYSFVALALSHGLDSGILDPLNRGILAVISATEKLLALPETELAGIAKAAKEKKLDTCELPVPDGAFSSEEAQEYTKMAATILAMKLLKADAEEMDPDEDDREITGVVYGAAALLGLDEDGCCMEYIRAYKGKLFGVPKKQGQKASTILS